MTTLAADLARNFEIGSINELPVIASDVIYEGAAVGDNASGYMRPLVAGDPFRGFAESTVDNSAGAAGDKKVRLRTVGLVQLTISSIAITDVGKPVYASDDNTFTLTATSNSYIGKVYRFVTTDTCIVAFNVTKGGSVTALTDSSGGSAGDTIIDVPGTYSEANLADQLASLTAKVNALIKMTK